MSAELDQAIINAVYSVCIAIYPPLLLDHKRRCMACQIEFDPPFHYNLVREEWIERPHYCEPCSALRILTITELFDQEGLRKAMLSLPDWQRETMSEEMISFEGPSRRLTPFIVPSPLSTPVNADMAYRIDFEPDMVYIDIESSGGEIPGFYADRFDEMIKRHTKRKAEAALKAPPSYLKHDPTKRRRNRYRKQPMPPAMNGFVAMIVLIIAAGAIPRIVVGRMRKPPRPKSNLPSPAFIAQHIIAYRAEVEEETDPEKRAVLESYLKAWEDMLDD